MLHLYCLKRKSEKGLIANKQRGIQNRLLPSLKKLISIIVLYFIKVNTYCTKLC